MAKETENSEMFNFLLLAKEAQDQTAVLGEEKQKAWGKGDVTVTNQ
jgi:hypothetical protein